MNLHSVLHNVKTAAVLIVHLLFYTHKRKRGLKVRNSFKTHDRDGHYVLTPTTSIFYQCSGFLHLFHIFLQAVRYPNIPGVIGFTVGAFGFFGFGLYPIALELGVEITYPVAEATSTAFIIISG